MALYYRTPVDVKIDMTDYVQNVIKQYREYLLTNAATPASEFLFKTNNNE